MITDSKLWNIGNLLNDLVMNIAKYSLNDVLKQSSCEYKQANLMDFLFFVRFVIMSIPMQTDK